MTLAGNGPWADTAKHALLIAKKAKLNKKKATGLLKVKVGRAGSVVLGGSEVKPRTKPASAAGKVMLPIVSKGKRRIS